MTRTGLTTPHSESKSIREVQELLVQRGFMHKAFIDGEAGPTTFEAIRTAKRVYGWPKRLRKRTTYGKRFIHALEADKAPARWAVRAAVQRRAWNRENRMRADVMVNAVHQIGTKEKPAGSNVVKYSTWYGLTGPWCAMFVTWLYVQAGSKSFARGSRWAYVPFLLSSAKSWKYKLQVTHNPLPGDVITFDWGGDGTPDHVGIVRSPKGNGSYVTIEGNTAVGNDSNGGEVMRRERNRGDATMTVIRVRG